MAHEYSIEYQLLRAGDLILAGVGGEIFTSFGLEIAEAARGLPAAADRPYRLVERILASPGRLRAGWL